MINKLRIVCYLNGSRKEDETGQRRDCRGPTLKVLSDRRLVGSGTAYSDAHSSDVT
jgi:hypothetical protein